jgi:UDP-N-acetylmuramoyl-tripeptide--D-alanyl-D-alanine ligase
MRINLPDPSGFAECFYSVTQVRLNEPVTGITTDSRNVKSGDLYIALSGQRTDGHNFVHTVELEGCKAVLVSKFQNKCKTIQQIKVDNPLNTLGLIAKHWRNNVTIPIIGITGTNGKTTTKELIKHIFSADKNVHATEGNYNTSVGVPLTLLTLTASHDISVLELGANQRGDIRYLCEISNPTHGLITNIAPAHLEGFGSVDDIAAEKGELFRSIHEGFSFINCADERINSLPNSGKKISFGLTPDCDFPADIISENDGNLLLIIDSEEIPIDSRNLSFLKNVISAAAVTVTLGTDWNVFRERISTFSPPKGRCQVNTYNNITVIDDTYNANLESTIAAIDYLQAFGGDGRNIFVFGDMYELGHDSENHHREIGKKCKNSQLDAVYLVGDDTRFTDIEMNAKISHYYFSSKTELTLNLKKSLREGDKVLVKGSRGMAMETVIQGLFN